MIHPSNPSRTWRSNFYTSPPLEHYVDSLIGFYPELCLTVILDCSSLSLPYPDDLPTIGGSSRDRVSESSISIPHNYVQYLCRSNQRRFSHLRRVCRLVFQANLE